MIPDNTFNEHKNTVRLRAGRYIFIVPKTSVVEAVPELKQRLVR